MTVGFIGLGNLGSAMARRLAEQQVALIVWNRTKAKAVASGLPLADSPADLAKRSDTIILNLFDSQAVRETLTSPNGLLSAGLRGKTVIDTTTNHFREVLEFHRMVAEAGGKYLEAPVLGSVMPASQGALTILVSGEKAAYESAAPILEKLGKHLFFLEKPGLASKMKLINNLVLGTIMSVLTEAVVMAERSGMPREQVMDILAVGAGSSAVLNAKRQKLLSEDFSPHFSVGAIYKDLRYVEDLLKEISMDSDLQQAAKAIFGKASDSGLAEMDLSAIYRTIAKQK
jgi:3-hydroxyisobutyrate dehydrogenase